VKIVRQYNLIVLSCNSVRTVLQISMICIVGNESCVFKRSYQLSVSDQIINRATLGYLVKFGRPGYHPL
jgi:hypothetical protein